MTAGYDSNVAKWLELAPTCASFHDNCLDTAEKLGLQKVKLGLDFKIVAGQGGSGKITHRADSATQAAVETRMNWSETISQLKKQ